jgi:hypothetical protein
VQVEVGSSRASRRQSTSPFLFRNTAAACAASAASLNCTPSSAAVAEKALGGLGRLAQPGEVAVDVRAGDDEGTEERQDQPRLRPTRP